MLLVQAYSLLLFAGSQTWELLQQRFKTSKFDGVFRDVYDGVEYRKHSEFLSHPAHVSLLLNTDGVAIFRSSAVSIWPVWVMINELPRAVRYVVFV